MTKKQTRGKKNLKKNGRGNGIMQFLYKWNAIEKPIFGSETGFYDYTTKHCMKWSSLAYISLELKNLPPQLLYET